MDDQISDHTYQCCRMAETSGECPFSHDWVNGHALKRPSEMVRRDPYLDIPQLRNIRIDTER